MSGAHTATATALLSSNSSMLLLSTAAAVVVCMQWLVRTKTTAAQTGQQRDTQAKAVA
jgi:hypothetical protein